ncbi:MAG: hypothetical protein JWR89_4629 [Tardiphaga sp.]|jgi:hypothetical protein|uniref:hypothetical protein n=1 Tax=Tardiphaga sp. TaxID=1926292 RepID=UPI002638E984|nr:hypothetical protein [Tardiphaga sp.]MDB5504727.1 hypothetical protein [Tardiphaga sp.]
MSVANRAARICILMILVFAASSSARADTFRKLAGGQIASKLGGMEFTDEVHWREVYERGGALRSYDMGKNRVGRWRVAADRVCVDREGTGYENCYQLWVEANRAEMRREADMRDPAPGILRAPTDQAKPTPGGHR